MATILVAIFSCLIRPIRRAIRKTGPCFTANNLIVDFLNGTVLIPFGLMIGSAFSKAIFEEALRTNKLFLTIGGFIGLIFVIREFINGEQTQQEASAPAVSPIRKLPNAPRKAANSSARQKSKPPRPK